MYIYSEDYIDLESKDKFFLRLYISNDKDNLDLYDSLLQELPDNPFLHKDLLVPCLVGTPMFFTLHDSDNSLLLLYPFIKRNIYIGNNVTNYADIISPYGFGGPLLSINFNHKSLNQFWKKVDHWYEQNNIISEFVRFNFNGNWSGYTGQVVPTLSNVCGKILPEEDQWDSFKPKVRNNVRKASNHGLKVEIYHKNITQSNILEFYNIYSKTMDRHKAESSYRYSLEFFSRFTQNNLESCALAIVYDRNRAVSVELILLSESIAYSFLGGTDHEYFNTRPNDLLKLNVMNWLRKHGYEFYFLGGGRTEHDSLYKYKKRFFPNDNDLTFYTGRKIIDPKVYNELVKYNGNTSNAISKSFFPLYRHYEN